MSRHTLHVTLSEQGINSAINYLETYRKEVEVKKTLILQKLAELGKQTAQSAYGTRISVKVSDIGNGYRFAITASGRDVCFLEFGAGTATSVGHPFATEMPFSVYPGSWSEQDKQMYSTYGWWKANGVTFTKIEPRKGMLEADKMITNRVVAIAREVFGY